MAPPWSLPLLPYPLWAKVVVYDTSLGQGAPVAAPSGGQPKWSEAAVRKTLSKTKRGRELLKKLPKDTKFAAFEKRAGDRRNGYYDSDTNTIYIASAASDRQAAPIAAHEAAHADQIKNHGRPKDDDVNDVIEMEVESKHAELDVYTQMGAPNIALDGIPYPIYAEYSARKRDRAGYEAKVREHYRRQYGSTGWTGSHSH